MGLFDRLTSTLTGSDGTSEDVRDDIQQALDEFEAGRDAAAEVGLLALAERARDVPAVFVALGDVRTRRGNLEGAVDAYGRAVDLSTQSVDAWLGLGEALARLGRVEPARDALRKVLSRTGEPGRLARAHAARGRLALAAGETSRAVRELRKAAELAPEDFAMAHDLGRALTAAGEPEGWSWLVRAAHAPRPEPAWVIAAAEAASDAASAEALLREALASLAGANGAADASAEPRLKAALAGCLAAAGRASAALAFAQEAVAARPADAATHRALRKAHAAAGAFKEALEAAAREAALGSPPPPSELVRLALGARDPVAVARAGALLPLGDPHAGLLAAMLSAAGAAPGSGRLREDDVVALGTLAPDEGSRRFVARALAPGDVPTGNLFALLAYARELAARSPELAGFLPGMARAAEAFDRPLLVAVMGEFNAGKSSFVNALCGRAVAPVGVTPTTATINVLRYGPRGARVLYHDGSAKDVPEQQIAGFLGRLDDAAAAAIRNVEIFEPLELLRRVEIVDTPGLNSLRPEHEAVARGFLVEADAIVWVFSVVQAAKATERDALGLAHEAGKRVLGVLNKADQASPEDLRTLERHVMGALGDRIEVLLPLSARQAASAEGEGAREGSGLSAVLDALEQRFFSRSRALKRKTAVRALERFLAEAGVAVGRASMPESGDERRRHLSEEETALRGALAAERVRLRVRLEEAFRRAAAEVLELMRPRAWPFGERRAEPADREFLIDLLEDAVLDATAKSAAEIRAAAPDGPAVPIEEHVERFRAYARGALRGGVVQSFLEHELATAGSRMELQSMQRALAAHVPDSDRELIQPLDGAIAAAYAAARAALVAEESREAMHRMIREERLDVPLAALGRALAELGPQGDG